MRPLGKSVRRRGIPCCSRHIDSVVLQNLCGTVEFSPIVGMERSDRMASLLLKAFHEAQHCVTGLSFRPDRHGFGIPGQFVHDGNEVPVAVLRLRLDLPFGVGVDVTEHRCVRQASRVRLAVLGLNADQAPVRTCLDQGQCPVPYVPGGLTDGDRVTEA